MNVDEWLSGGGAPAISWRDKPIGATVSGIICEEPAVSQQRDYDTGEPEFWDDEKTRPKMVLILTVKTDLRDPSRIDDDGARRIFFQGKSLADGIREQARKAGGKLLVGGHVTVTYVGDGEQPNKRYKPPKLFRVAYTPPPVRNAVSDFLDQEPSAHAAPAPAAPAAKAASAHAGPPHGVDPAAWTNLDEARRAQILAALSSPSSVAAPF